MSLADVLESIMKGKQQTNMPELSPGIPLADVRAMAEGDLVEAGSEPDLPKDAVLPKVSVFGVDFTQSAQKYSQDPGRFETAKIPLDNRIHGTVVKKLQGEWYRVLTQGVIKALPERILTKVE